MPKKLTHGGKRDGAGAPKKFTCEIIAFQITAPKDAKDAIKTFAHKESKKYLIKK